MRPELNYYRDEDVLYLVYADGPEAASRVLAPHITAEYLADGTLRGIEILRAATVLQALLQPLLEAPEPEAE
jgi:uncharacterized protein YuzE